ncbi:hypothetical protein BGZ47_002155 [Haplosporangium gracile]|nr:hypothetical protein BGZ47_002155 [Haplosporangium gracile]
MALTDCDTQGKIMDRDDTFDGAGNSYEFIYDLSEEMNPREYWEETAASLWAFVFAESDEDDSFSNDKLNHAAHMVSFGAEEDLSHSDSRLFQQYIDDGPAVSPLAVTPSNLTLPVSSEKERDDSCMGEPLATQSQLFFEKGSLRRRSSSKGDAQVSKLKSSSLDVIDGNVSHSRSSIVNRNLPHIYISFQGCVDKRLKSDRRAFPATPSSIPHLSMNERTHKKSESRLDVTKTLQSSVIPKLKAVKERGKENRPPRTALFTQPSSSRPHNTASFNGSSEVKTPKHGRSGQAKAGGFATAFTEGKHVESRSEAAASDDDDDFMPSQVTTKNAPIVKKTSIKKQRH